MNANMTMAFEVANTFIEDFTIDSRITTQKRGSTVIIYFVTYILLFADGNTKECVKSFARHPSRHVINEVGDELIAEHNAVNFCASRGKRDWNGKWIDCE